MSVLSDFIRARFESSKLQSEYGARSECTLVSNQTNLVVGYATGLATYHTGPARLEGVLSHYFSDKVWDDPRTASTERNPFSPTAFAKTNIRIERTGAETLAVTLTRVLSMDRRDWLQAKLAVVACDADVLVCSGAGFNVPEAMYLLTIALPREVVG